MGFRYRFTLLLFSLCNAEFTNMGPKTFDNYGPYHLDIPYHEKCNGPKSKTLATYDVKLQNNNTQFFFNATYLETVRIDEIRITVFTHKGNEKTLLWNYKLNKPCEHFLLANTIATTMKAKNCVVKKGNYNVTIDYVEYSNIFFGNSFFYGEYRMKSTVLSSKGNIMCIIMNFVFSKLK